MTKQSKQNPEIMNTSALAYLGDAVWELAVRDRLIAGGMSHVDRLQKTAVSYVSAEAQSRILKGLMELKIKAKADILPVDDTDSNTNTYDSFLTEDELALVRRAKNHRLVASKKNSKKSVMTDKYATAFEALIGYLYLKDDTKRLDEVTLKALEMADGL